MSLIDEMSRAVGPEFGLVVRRDGRPDKAVMLGPRAPGQSAFAVLDAEEEAYGRAVSVAAKHEDVKRAKEKGK